MIHCTGDTPVRAAMQMEWGWLMFVLIGCREKRWDVVGRRSLRCSAFLGGALERGTTGRLIRPPANEALSINYPEAQSVSKEISSR